MDPVTLALMAAGFIFFGAMCFFFLGAKTAIENATKYRNETQRINQVLEVNSRQLENQKKELEKYRKKIEYFETSQYKSSSQQVSKEDAEFEILQRKLSELISEMDQEKPKWREELGVSEKILNIAGEYNVSNAFTLVYLILQSIVLGSHLNRPEDAIGEVRKKSNDLESRSRELLEKIALLVERLEKSGPSQSNSVHITVQPSEHMGNTYRNDGDTFNIGQAGAVGRNARSDNNEFYQSGQNRTLAEAANEIQNLLKQLEQTYPGATETEKVVYVNDETTPSFKRRVVSALQAGGEAAIEEFFDNPYLNIGKAIVKGWMKPE